MGGGGGAQVRRGLGVGTPGPAPQVTALHEAFQEAEDLRGRKEGRVQS